MAFLSSAVWIPKPRPDPLTMSWKLWGFPFLTLGWQKSAINFYRWDDATMVHCYPNSNHRRCLDTALNSDHPRWMLFGLWVESPLRQITHWRAWIQLWECWVFGDLSIIPCSTISWMVLVLNTLWWWVCKDSRWPCRNWGPSGKGGGQVRKQLSGRTDALMEGREGPLGPESVMRLRRWRVCLEQEWPSQTFSGITALFCYPQGRSSSRQMVAGGLRPAEEAWQ